MKVDGNFREFPFSFFNQPMMSSKEIKDPWCDLKNPQ